ncbi:putative F-box protein At4g17565 [Musa acuminata AAA Group]|uniref:putative F-box protein At4g17565 n=1 Tax=Musa acuminata AAA Group TaxID=214697 RepID=UPI0031CFC313
MCHFSCLTVKEMRRSSRSCLATSCCSTEPSLRSELWRPWSDLPIDIMMEIAERLLPNATNLARFSAVCRSWWSIVKEETSLARQFPWLMLAEEEIDFPSSSGSNICRRFYSCSKKRIYELPVLQCQGRFCCGSYAGWIATVGKDSKDASREHLYWRRRRAAFALRLRPSACRDCLVVAFYGIGCKLGIAKVGDDQWTTVSCNWCPYLDASFYKGQFYVVNWKGDVVVLDVSRPQVHFISTKPKQLMTDYTHRKIYLVESSGDLLYVVRVFRYSPKPTYNTKSFVVYKLSVSNGELQQVNSLGEGGRCSWASTTRYRWRHQSWWDAKRTQFTSPMT